MGRLTPTPFTGEAVAARPRVAGGYATLTMARVKRLARAMPDAQSAVLVLLAWQATLHERMSRGPLAGRPAASWSGSQLAAMTDRPIRTVRHALERLRAAGLIEKGPSAAGRKSVYTLPFLGGRPEGASGVQSPAGQSSGRGAGLALVAAGPAAAPPAAGCDNPAAAPAGVAGSGVRGTGDDR